MEKQTHNHTKMNLIFIGVVVAIALLITLVLVVKNKQKIVAPAMPPPEIIKPKILPNTKPATETPVLQPQR